MKKGVLFLLLLTCLNEGIAQVFVEVTTGPIVSDGASSFSGSWVDIDNDGDLDLFVTTVLSENDILYLNTGAGFSKVSISPLVSDGQFTEAATWGDYDNDGDLDLFVANQGGNNLLYRNNGGGSFSKITSGSIVNDGGTSLGATWGDYDNDGYIDLFVGNFNFENDFLYRNNGNGTFTRITSGDIVNDGQKSVDASWADYDNDGFLDLFVANFGGKNMLYHNNGNGTFSKVLTGPIVNDINADSHGCSWGDYDNDGDLDLFVTTSNNQNDFFYINNGGGSFTKVTSGVLMSDQEASCGSGWADFDNDGDLDLFVANTSVQSSSLYNVLYINDNGTFQKITVSGTVSNGRGISWGDYDNDGDLDLFVANEGNMNDKLFENTGGTNSWINIKCIGTISNKASIGARVKVKARVNENSFPWQMQEISAQTGYMSMNSLNAEFGLGEATIIDTIEVRWPSGVVCRWMNVPVNQFITLSENCTMLGSNEYKSDAFTLKIFPNPSITNSVISYVLAQPSAVNVEIFNLMGQRIESIDLGRQNKGKNHFDLDTRSMIPGSYLVKVITNDSFSVARLTVNR